MHVQSPSQANYRRRLAQQQPATNFNTKQNAILPKTEYGMDMPSEVVYTRSDHDVLSQYHENSALHPAPLSSRCRAQLSLYWRPCLRESDSRIHRFHPPHPPHPPPPQPPPPHPPPLPHPPSPQPPPPPPPPPPPSPPPLLPPPLFAGRPPATQPVTKPAVNQLPAGPAPAACCSLNFLTLHRIHITQLSHFAH